MELAKFGERQKRRKNVDCYIYIYYYPHGFCFRQNSKKERDRETNVLASEMPYRLRFHRFTWSIYVVKVEVRFIMQKRLLDDDDSDLGKKKLSRFKHNARWMTTGNKEM